MYSGPQTSNDHRKPRAPEIASRCFCAGARPLGCSRLAILHQSFSKAGRKYPARRTSSYGACPAPLVCVGPSPATCAGTIRR